MIRKPAFRQWLAVDKLKEWALVGTSACQVGQHGSYGTDGVSSATNEHLHSSPKLVTFGPLQRHLQGGRVDCVVHSNVTPAQVTARVKCLQRRNGDFARAEKTKET